MLSNFQLYFKSLAYPLFSLYILMCVYVCVCIYMYMYICVCMCILYVYELDGKWMYIIHAPYTVKNFP